MFQNITLSKQNRKLHLGEITLLDNAKLMKDAVVTAQMAQVEMKADTFIYNADAFRIPAGSNFEALLKKFPGAEITEEGTIKINGKEVKKILVNKKEFFGIGQNSGSSALRNRLRRSSCSVGCEYTVSLSQYLLIVQPLTLIQAA